MKIVSSPNKIEQIICDAIKNYKNISFAVAWASANNKASKLLLQTQDKLKECTVGLHFYQTDSKFIEPFVEKGPVKFIKKVKGVFHPKIYLFWDDEFKWTCLIGSANLTHSALNFNDEIMVHLKSPDDNAFHEIYNKIKDYYNQATFITQKDFFDYLSNKQKRIISDDFKEVSALNLSQLFQLSWEEYYLRLQNTQYFDDRLNMLTKAQNLLQLNSFQNLDELTRKNIAGVTKKGNQISDWHLFGRMPVPYFAKRLSDSDTHKSYKDISRQLDQIIFNEENITKETYDSFLEYFKDHEGWGYSISTISRLLTMKRPDQFFCITQANEKGLLEALDTNKSIQHDSKENMYERYWFEIIQTVRCSPWFKAKVSKNKLDKEYLAWKYRVALMDALLYVE